jgi:hypothetical protein
MTKAKGSGDGEGSGKTVKLERYGVEVDPATVVKVEDRGDEVVIYTEPQGPDGPKGNYSLTREEAEPFLGKE